MLGSCIQVLMRSIIFFFQAEDGIRDLTVTGVQTCALPIFVVVTHELNLAAEYADQVVLMQRGRCLRVGPPISIYQRELLEQVFQTPLTEIGRASCRERV